MIRNPHTMSVADYEARLATGEFLHDDIELVRGEIHAMSPAGPLHDEVVTYLEEWSRRWAPPVGYRVRSEKGILLAESNSVPEPDVVWVRKGRYFKRKPVAADIGLLIEVADSSLDFDLNEKAGLYAESASVEYWVVNCFERSVQVMRRPRADHYEEIIHVPHDGAISPLANPDAQLVVAKIFADEIDDA